MVAPHSLKYPFPLRSSRLPFQDIFFQIQESENQLYYPKQNVLQSVICFVFQQKRCDVKIFKVHQSRNVLFQCIVNHSIPSGTCQNSFRQCHSWAQFGLLLQFKEFTLRNCQTAAQDAWSRGSWTWSIPTSRFSIPPMQCVTNFQLSLFVLFVCCNFIVFRHGMIHLK